MKLNKSTGIIIITGILSIGLVVFVRAAGLNMSEAQTASLNVPDDAPVKLEDPLDDFSIDDSYKLDDRGYEKRLGLKSGITQSKDIDRVIVATIDSTSEFGSNYVQPNNVTEHSVSTIDDRRSTVNASEVTSNDNSLVPTDTLVPTDNSSEVKGSGRPIAIYSEGDVVPKRYINEHEKRFSCSVHGYQEISDRGPVVIRNEEDVYYGNLLIPANSRLHGRAKFSRDRVLIDILTVTIGDLEKPVSFSVIGDDLLEGIFFQGALDEAVDDSEDDLAEELSDELRYGEAIRKITGNIKEAMEKKKVLRCEDGYSIFILIKK